MVQIHHLTILSIISMILLIFLSKCHSYPFYNDKAIPERPTKAYLQVPVDKHINRIKQYYDTIAQLKNWRRDIDLSDEEDDETFQDMFQPYNDFDYKH